VPKTALHQLTRLEIVNAKAATRPYTLVDGGRLYVLVRPDGTKLWRWNYDLSGKTKTMALGRWSEVSEKEARAAHAAGRQLLRLGVDPMERWWQTKAQARFNVNSTFESVAKVWISEQKAHWSVNYLDKIERRLVKNVYPWLGSRPIADITTPEYVAVIHRARDREA
jgi:hypothetical protein